MGMINGGLIKMKKKDKKFNKWGYNINEVDRKGLDNNGYNINGYDTSGYDRRKYKIYGYKQNGLDRWGNKRKALKKYIPGSGLKILTPQQMLACLPIFLAQTKAGNNSRELKNKIRQLLYSLYRSKQISKKLKNLIATI